MVLKEGACGLKGMGGGYILFLDLLRHFCKEELIFVVVLDKCALGGLPCAFLTCVWFLFAE